MEKQERGKSEGREPKNARSERKKNLMVLKLQPCNHGHDNVPCASLQVSLSVSDADAKHTTCSILLCAETRRQELSFSFIFFFLLRAPHRFLRLFLSSFKSSCISTENKQSLTIVLESWDSKLATATQQVRKHTEHT